MSREMNEILELFKEDERIYSNGGYLVGQIQELALKYDEILISTLLKDENLKKSFFVEIEGVLVFKREEFVEFIGSKNFLDDSYTRFKNMIGLSDGRRYLRENKEVVLAWPYKDCVLEGGQDEEDAKRDEVFYNEVLAVDDIDRLLEPKVLTNWKKYTSHGEVEVKTVNKGDNLILKGNNLIGVHSLLHKYKKQVKMVYIDIPYNTDSSQSSFGYNNKFNHPTWLTFMKNRLSAAKELLRADGAIFVQCDNSELGYLLVLMDEVYGKKNFESIISWQRASQRTALGQGQTPIIDITEYILVYKKEEDHKALKKSKRIS